MGLIAGGGLEGRGVVRDCISSILEPEVAFLHVVPRVRHKTKGFMHVSTCLRLAGSHVHGYVPSPGRPKHGKSCMMLWKASTC